MLCPWRQSRSHASGATHRVLQHSDHHGSAAGRSTGLRASIGVFGPDGAGDFGTSIRRILVQSASCLGGSIIRLAGITIARKQGSK